MKVPQRLSVRVAALILVIAVVLVMAPRPGGRAYALEIKARAAVLMDYESGRIIFSQNPDVQLPPASVTKLMTMLLIAESIDSGRAKWDDLIRTSKNAAGMGGSQVYLREGEEMTLAEMTKAIAMVSANDASTAVAEYLYGSVELFIQKMNQRAQELGLKNTNFQNEHGLPDPKHYSSAHDLALIARELIRHPKILEWTSTWISYLRDGEFFLRNTNDLIQSYRGADGLKTGHTEEAGYCLCATAEVEGLRFISVIMGAETNQVRVDESTKLLNYGFRNFARAAVASQGEKLGTIRVRRGNPQDVPVGTSTDYAVLVERGKERFIETKLLPEEQIKLPLKRGQQIGTLIVMSGKEEVGRTAVVALQDVKQANFVVRFFRWLGDVVRGWFGRGAKGE
jgi:D-alanyl-D-alanine carboxypeptidase (penicillin-binding protein 5/6)